jgi:uroporphyrinogen decarboxylase
MNSKERVKRAANLGGPDRFPLRYAFCVERSDIAGCGVEAAADWEPEDPHQDEWGFTWDTLSDTIVSSFGQVKGHPLSDWDGTTGIEVPDPYAAGRLDGINRTIREHPEKYIAAGLGLTGMNRATFLRGMEQFFVDLYVNRPLALKIIHTVFEWESAMIKQIVEIPDVDAVGFADDWGTQKALMIDPKLWRELFKPLYAKQFEMIRGKGKDVLFHSCGYVFDIIGDLIDIGANILNVNQPRLMGIDNLQREFAGRVCFMCPVDMQTTLIHGSKEEIEAEARSLVEKLARQEGGFIACMDEGIDHGYIPRQRIAWMEAAFLKLAEEKVSR